MRLFSRVQPLMKLEVDQKSSSLRRRSDEAFLSCAAADEAVSVHTHSLTHTLTHTHTHTH